MNDIVSANGFEPKEEKVVVVEEEEENKESSLLLIDDITVLNITTASLYPVCSLF